jgi:hypothetical protein
LVLGSANPVALAATAGSALDAVAASWTIRSEEDRLALSGQPLGPS